MPEATRRQFIESVGSAAVATVLAPGALAAALPASAQAAPASPPASPSSFYTYQSEIYARGMISHVTPKITTNLSKLEAQASKVLDRRAREYFLAGEGGRVAARTSASAFHSWRIIPRMFRAHAERDLSATVLGTRMPAPVILAPVARQKLAHPDGELASTRAAAALGLTYVQSMTASFSIEQVAAASGTGPRWYQLDWPNDGALDVSRLRRARAAGYTHLLLGPPRPGGSWKQLRLIRKSWDGPIMLTGVQTVRDAKLAARRGFDGVGVSSHGGRQVDSAIAPLNALPAIAAAVGHRLAVLFDASVRTGPDTFKALALGADAVLIGVPYVYGLALDGQAGVTHVLRTLLAEFDLTVANSGYRSQRELSRASLARA